MNANTVFRVTLIHKHLLSVVLTRQRVLVSLLFNMSDEHRHAWISHLPLLFLSLPDRRFRRGVWGFGRGLDPCGARRWGRPPRPQRPQGRQGSTRGKGSKRRYGRSCVLILAYLSYQTLHNYYLHKCQQQYHYFYLYLLTN